jgi:hypothetical protein
MKLNKIAGAVALVAMCSTFTACSTTVRYTSGGAVKHAKKRHGPPPHAPAHGYRHKHGDVVLVFDSALEVYAVHGHAHHYFHGKHYYRSTNSGWEMTTHFGKRWKPCSTKKLPKGLRHSVQAKNKKWK